MTGTSEWYRAGLAVSGVTIVLLIAAGIHFILPARSDRMANSPAPTATTRPVTPAASIESSMVTAEPAPTMQALPPSVARRPLKPTRRVPVNEDAANQLPPGGNEPVFATPLALSLEIPEKSLLQEPILLAVSAEYVELPAAPSDDPGARDVIAPATRERDPVSAAVVTAGSAVASGFRSAGRAFKRAF
jgi:hypothetical protein